jgi:hypothetical protein
MARMMELVRSSALPSHRMQAASRGALTVEPAEMIEIMVFLANNNKIYGQQARMTLAGYDEASSLQVAGNPAAPKEVLKYMISPDNLRPVLLPVLLENPGVMVDWIVELAATGSRDVAETIQKSNRAGQSTHIRNALAANANVVSVPKLESTKDAGQGAEAVAGHPAGTPNPTSGTVAGPSAAGATNAASILAELSEPDPDPAVNEGIASYLTANAGEISAETGKAFQPIGGMLGMDSATEEETVVAVAESTPAPSSAATTPAGAATAAKPALAFKPKPQVSKRDNTLQKINKLDVKERIQLAMKGSKEERSILIRDGTKVVALAVLESPKITDGEVEKFASQKNVLEAVLRAIPMKRRFQKLYSVTRNLVANPRTPLDVSLGLMKHILAQDLKNLAGNKDVSETVRKLAIKMYKQKTELANKNS